MRKMVFFFFVLSAPFLGAEERRVDPTWLHRYLPALSESPADVTTPTCHYKPVFGAGEPDAGNLKSVARYGEMIVDPQGASALVNYPNEEQVYFVREGTGTILYGSEKVAIRSEDFIYVPPGIRHGVENRGIKPCRLILMGFRVPAGANLNSSAKPLLANLAEVPKQEVAGHPPSTLFQLLVGKTDSQRDKLAAAQVLTSLFVMEFDTGGTNWPHHHDREEEIYLVLEGQGEMVAGSGMDGIEGRRPAKAGDAYFFRLNCTVGFYSKTGASEPKARILAARSSYPF
jgi:mannose-6-phosphate isomerase-like protein (cupin superfamily)